MFDPASIPPERPVLIAGPTASGKSALALAIACTGGGVVVNADALQVFANWRVLTARPSRDEEAAVAHALYGHVPGDAAYSVGAWLRAAVPFLDGPQRPIFVGGTGLYFAALTEGLAEIPPTPPDVRAEADALLAAGGAAPMLGLAAWQDDTPPPALPLADATALVLDAPRDWLRARIARRFDAMLAQGALEEARANLPGWSDTLPSAKAIGARELIAHLRGEIGLDEARRRSIVASRQYAKRQRTWFRARMRRWQSLSPADLA